MKMKKQILKIAAASLLAALVVPSAMGDKNDANIVKKP